MRRVAAIIVASCVGLIGVAWLIGMSLPVAHVASATRDLPRSPEDVYRLVSDIEAYPQWWRDVSRVEIVARDTDGRVTFRQYSGNDSVVMQVVERQPPTRFVTRIADPDQPFGGTWTFEIAATGPPTRLAITERGEVYHPLFRFLSRFVFGHTSTLESFLDAASR